MRAPLNVLAGYSGAFPLLRSRLVKRLFYDCYLSPVDDAATVRARGERMFAVLSESSFYLPFVSLDPFPFRSHTQSDPKDIDTHTVDLDDGQGYWVNFYRVYLTICDKFFYMKKSYLFEEVNLNIFNNTFFFFIIIDWNKLMRM